MDKRNATTVEQSNIPKSDKKVGADSQHQNPQNMPLIKGDETFLAYGFGKHACPGRFFAAHKMKLMLAYLVQHYDIEYMSERPAQTKILEGSLPARSATIKIRTRLSKLN